MAWLWLWLGLVTGNFLFALCLSDKPDWEKAIDRSFFQGVAILAAWLKFR